MRKLKIVDPCDIELVASTGAGEFGSKKLASDSPTDYKLHIQKPGVSFSYATPSVEVDVAGGLVSGDHSLRMEASPEYQLGPGSFSDPLKYRVKDPDTGSWMGQDGLGVKAYSSVPNVGPEAGATRIGERWCEWGDAVYSVSEVDEDRPSGPGRRVIVQKLISATSAPNMAFIYRSDFWIPITTPQSVNGSPIASPDLFVKDDRLFVAVRMGNLSRIKVVEITEHGMVEVADFAEPEVLAGQLSRVRLRAASGGGAVMIACYGIRAKVSSQLSDDNVFVTFVSSDDMMSFRTEAGSSSTVVMTNGQLSVSSKPSTTLELMFTPRREALTEASFYKGFNHKFALYYDRNLACFVIMKSGDPFMYSDSEVDFHDNAIKLIAIKTLPDDRFKWEMCLKAPLDGLKVLDVTVSPRETDNVAVLLLMPADAYGTEGGGVDLGEESLVRFAFVHQSQVGGAESVYDPFTWHRRDHKDWHWVSTPVNLANGGLTAVQVDSGGGTVLSAFGDLRLAGYRGQIVAGMMASNDWSSLVATMGAWSEIEDRHPYQFSYFPNYKNGVASGFQYISTNGGSIMAADRLTAPVPSATSFLRLPSDRSASALPSVGESGGYFKLKLRCRFNIDGQPGEIFTLLSYENADTRVERWIDRIHLLAERAGVGAALLHIQGSPGDDLTSLGVVDSRGEIYLTKVPNPIAGEDYVYVWLRGETGWSQVFAEPAAPRFTNWISGPGSADPAIAIGICPVATVNPTPTSAIVDIQSFMFGSFLNGVGGLSDFGPVPYPGRYPTTDAKARIAAAQARSEGPTRYSIGDAPAGWAKTFLREVTYMDGSVLAIDGGIVETTGPKVWSWASEVTKNSPKNLLNQMANSACDATNYISPGQPWDLVFENKNLSRIDAFSLINMSGLDKIELHGGDYNVATQAWTGPSYEYDIPKIELKVSQVEGRVLTLEGQTFPANSLVGRTITSLSSYQGAVGQWVVVSNADSIINVDIAFPVGGSERLAVILPAGTFEVPDWVKAGIYQYIGLSLTPVSGATHVALGEVVIGELVDLSDLVTASDMSHVLRYGIEESSGGLAFSPGTAQRNIVREMSITCETMEYEVFSRIDRRMLSLYRKSKPMAIAIEHHDGTLVTEYGILAEEVERSLDNYTYSLEFGVVLQQWQPLPMAGAPSGKIYGEIRAHGWVIPEGYEFNFSVVARSITGTPLSYFWHYSGGADTSSDPYFDVEPSSPGTYTVFCEITDAVGNTLQLSENFTLLAEAP